MFLRLPACTQYSKQQRNVQNSIILSFFGNKNICGGPRITDYEPVTQIMHRLNLNKKTSTKKVDIQPLVPRNINFRHHQVN